MDIAEATAAEAGVGAAVGEAAVTKACAASPKAAAAEAAATVKAAEATPAEPAATMETAKATAPERNGAFGADRDARGERSTCQQPADQLLSVHELPGHR